MQISPQILKIDPKHSQVQSEIQLKPPFPIHNFKFYNMFSIVEKLTNEVQAFFKILIPSVVVLRKSIEDKKNTCQGQGKS